MVKFAKSQPFILEIKEDKQKMEEIVKSFHQALPKKPEEEEALLEEEEKAAKAKKAKTKYILIATAAIVLIFFGFAWFVFLVAGEKNLKSVLFLGWLIFTVKALWVNSFFLSIKPNSWIDDGWFVGTMIVVCSWFLVSSFIGLAGLFLAGAISFLNKYLNIIYLGFFVPVLLVVSEVLGSLIFSIISYGTGSTINANYSFGYVGYFLAQHQLLLTTASFGGVYFLTYVVS